MGSQTAAPLQAPADGVPEAWSLAVRHCWRRHRHWRCCALLLLRSRLLLLARSVQWWQWWRMMRRHHLWWQQLQTVLELELGLSARVVPQLSLAASGEGRCRELGYNTAIGGDAENANLGVVFVQAGKDVNLNTSKLVAQRSKLVTHGLYCSACPGIVQHRWCRGDSNIWGQPSITNRGGRNRPSASTSTSTSPSISTWHGRIGIAGCR